MFIQQINSIDKVKISVEVEHLCTLVYPIEVQAQIKVQVGEFLKINKRAGETSCKKKSNVQDLLSTQYN